MGRDTAEIFLSYKAEEREAAQRLAAALEAAGHSVWWDHALQGGDDYALVIERRIAAARLVIPLWSRAAAASQWVRAEAQKGQGKLLPVRIEAVDPPAPFNALHTIDLSGWRGDRQDPRFQRLLGDIRARLQGAPPAAIGKDTPRPRRFSPRAFAAWIGAPTAALTLSLVAFQNVAAVCEATGLLCPKPAAVSAPAPAPIGQAGVSLPAPARAPLAIPALCQAPALANALQDLAPAAGRAEVAICGAAGCGGPFRVGEKVEFRLTSSVAGRAILIDVGAESGDTRLFPNEFASGRSGAVAAGTPLLLPQPDWSFETRATRAEKGCLLAIVAPEAGAAARYIAGDVARTKGFGNFEKAQGAEVARLARQDLEAGGESAGWALGFATYEVVE